MHVLASGRICYIVNREYDFITEEGERKQGISRKVVLTSILSEQPATITVPQNADPSVVAEFERLFAQAEHLKPVTLRVSIGKSSNSFVGVEKIG